MLFSTVVKSQATTWTQNGHSPEPTQNQPQQLAFKPKRHQKGELRVDTKKRKSLQTREMARPIGFEPMTSAIKRKQSRQRSDGNILSRKMRDLRMAHPIGVEPMTFASGGQRSIQLS